MTVHLLLLLLLGLPVTGSSALRGQPENDDMKQTEEAQEIVEDVKVSSLMADASNIKSIMTRGMSVSVDTLPRGRAKQTSENLGQPAGMDFPGQPAGMDEEIFGHADRIKGELAAMEESAAPADAKPVATMQQQESTAQKAARFFAVHGLGKVGEALGHEISQTQAEHALKEREALHHNLQTAVGISAADADKLLSEHNAA